jgi:hypothetical protein
MSKPQTARPRQSRIPFTLQAVFLASNRGKDVHKPPPENAGSKVFFCNWFFQRKPDSKKKKFNKTKSGKSLLSDDAKKEKEESKEVSVRRSWDQMPCIMSLTCHQFLTLTSLVAI